MQEAIDQLDHSIGQVIHSGDIGQKLEEFITLHVDLPCPVICDRQALPCFSLQEMQDRVHGIALRRASAIGSPQSLQTP